MVCAKNLPCDRFPVWMGTQPPGSGLRRALRRLRRTGTNCTCLLTTATPLIYPSSVRLSSFPTHTGVPGTYRKGAEAQELRTKARAFLLGRDRSDRWTDDG
eukprot:scaffold43909_cov71-Attheya_sp.AAC.1